MDEKLRILLCEDHFFSIPKSTYMKIAIMEFIFFI